VGQYMAESPNMVAPVLSRMNNDNQKSYNFNW